MEQAREHHHLGGHGRITGGFDLLVAVLLGLTVMAIAWGAYQAELKAKDADHYFNRSDETLATSHKLELQGDRALTSDENLFLELERAEAQGNTQLIDFLQSTFARPAFAAAVAWWRAQPTDSRPATPFVPANPAYQNPSYARAAALQDSAAGYLKKAHKAEQNEIDFTIVIVVLTVALFLLGMATQIIVRPVKVGLVLFGALILLGSVGRFIDLAI